MPSLPHALLLTLLLVLSGCPKPPAQRADAGQQPATKRSKRPRSARAVADTFIKRLIDQRFGQAAQQLSPRMAKAMNAAKLKELWATLEKQAGEYREIKVVRQRLKVPYTIVVFTLGFEKRAMDLQVTVSTTGHVAGLYYRPRPLVASKRPPPPYADKTRYKEVSVVVGAKPWALAGTLTLPVSATTTSKAPAVVLIHGSGPHDRDETVGPNKPFRDLAWGLASRGVAVLRYVKRTLAHQAAVTRELEKLTVKGETIDDALEALKLLRTRPELAPDQIFVLGHSLGGYVLPRIAARDDGKTAAGLIFVAANARPLEELVLAQYTYLSKLDGRVTGHEKKRLAHVKAKIERLKKGIKPDTPRQLLPLNLTAAYWLDLQAYKPLTLIKTIKKPMLFLQGERDYQVTIQDLMAWKRALAGRRDVRFARYPKANHLLIDGEGKPRPAEYKNASYVTKQAIIDIAAFISKSAKKR